MPENGDTPPQYFVRPDEATGFVAEVMRRAGLPERHAETVAGCLVEADLRGADTHGIARLPVYVERLERGMVEPDPDLKLDKATPVAAALDGGNGLGFVVGRHAMEAAIAMAAEYGLGLVAARRSNHFGMAASYALQALEAGYISMVFSNASKAMPPWGGRVGLLGTNPLAVGVPSGDEVPYLLDMSPAVAARGKIRRAERRGEAIPLGYALDAEGRPTTDATAALGGVVLPLGGPKGSAIAMLMDILGGVFSGAAFGGDVNDQYKVWDEPQNVGHMFLAIRPGLFMTEAAFRERMDELVRRVHMTPRAEGFDEVLMPGEIEARLTAERQRSGIPYKPADLAPLDDLAAKFGLERLARRDAPLA